MTIIITMLMIISYYLTLVNAFVLKLIILIGTMILGTVSLTTVAKGDGRQMDKNDNIVDSFWEWAEVERESRNLSWYAVERKAGLSSGAIARRANYGQAPTDTTCTAIAEVFGLPPETVFRKAGLLPQRTMHPSEIEELIDLLKHLPDADLDRVLLFVETLYRYNMQQEETAAGTSEARDNES